MVEDDLFLSDRLSVEHIRLLFPGLHADDDISELFIKLNGKLITSDNVRHLCLSKLPKLYEV